MIENNENNAIKLSNALNRYSIILMFCDNRKMLFLHLQGRYPGYISDLIPIDSNSFFLSIIIKV